MTDDTTPGLGTLAVHAGIDPSGSLGATTTPIYQSVSFVAPDTQTLEDINHGRKRGFVYSRVRNPTVMAAEKRIAALEGAEAAVLFSSGMAACAGALAPLLSAGDEIVALRDVYGVTARYFDEFLPRMGVTVRWVPSLDPASLVDHITERTRVIYVETPTNPLVRVVDIPAMAAAAKQANVTLVVDGTLGGPANQRPLELGADVLIHSATKYLNGHGDVLAGAVVGSRTITRAVRSMSQTTGATMDPHAAWLLMRGMATYQLRMARHNASGAAVAQFLNEHTSVTRVHYPGLPDHPDHTVAKRQMSGYGGLISFECGSAELARHVVDSVCVFGIGPSVGGVESLISQPANTSHHSVSPERRREMGIADDLVRISVGIEDTKDLIDDLSQALANRS